MTHWRKEPPTEDELRDPKIVGWLSQSRIFAGAQAFTCLVTQPTAQAEWAAAKFGGVNKVQVFERIAWCPIWMPEDEDADAPPADGPEAADAVVTAAGATAARTAPP